MRLTVVIPAYNEEDAIGATIERTLAARELIVARSPVDDVEIIVVSDGSTDQTARIAARYDQIKLIEFDRNRGYGAAIKRGFEEGGAELVGFLDADGTCDPRFFADLCSAVIESDAAVALGSRLGPDSRMPLVRRLGNRVYAIILSLLSNRPVTDTASGMRVIRREVLSQLYPLPDGLNFTPAMSARVLVDDRLRIIELPMAYEERVGQSKLHVLRDGLAFFRTIGEMTLMWRPSRLFAIAAALCLLTMVVLTAHPAEMWLRAGHLEEDMIYRLLFCSLLGSVAAVLLSATVLADALHFLVDDPPPPLKRWATRPFASLRNGVPPLKGWDTRRTSISILLDRLYTLKSFAVIAILTTPVITWLIGGGVLTLITDGHVYVHWSRVVLAGLLAFALVQMLVTILIANVMRFHTSRKELRVITAKSADRRTVPAVDLVPQPCSPQNIVNSLQPEVSGAPAPN